ncbi:histidine acid phosphatase superfamily protein, partial [Toxoplasma gondii MAS]
MLDAPRDADDRGARSCGSSSSGVIQLSIGVCAMKAKTHSKPMRAILSRLERSLEFRIVVFDEQMILEEDITTWPRVDCLICFYSTGFPLDKAIGYVKRFRPILLNDLEQQRIIRDRVLVYKQLQRHGIPHPPYVVVDYERVSRGEAHFEEGYDYIVFNDKRLNKPFIEKPRDADNHDNWIYYPKNAGGGCKKLYRKQQNSSSSYCPDVHSVRKDGTYIYEEFLSTFGTDVKVYTVGPLFAHAEARKSPSVDGVVCRSPDGKEVRYPVILTEQEKWIAYRLVRAFQQIICGFDILRTSSGPFVCDVNGFSFVKGNVKYYEDCANILRLFFIKKSIERWSAFGVSPQLAAPLADSTPAACAQGAGTSASGPSDPRGGPPRSTDPTETFVTGRNTELQLVAASPPSSASSASFASPSPLFRASSPSPPLHIVLQQLLRARNEYRAQRQICREEEKRRERQTAEADLRLPAAAASSGGSSPEGVLGGRALLEDEKQFRREGGKTGGDPASAAESQDVCRSRKETGEQRKEHKRTPSSGSSPLCLAGLPSRETRMHAPAVGSEETVAAREARRGFGVGEDSPQDGALSPSFSSFSVSHAPLETDPPEDRAGTMSPYTTAGEASGDDDEELRTVVVVMRHGDRKPKQKLKFKTDQDLILELFDEERNRRKEIKLKSPEELRDLLDRNTEIITFLGKKMMSLVADKKSLDEQKAVLEARAASPSPSASCSACASPDSASAEASDPGASGHVSSGGAGEEDSVGLTREAQGLQTALEKKEAAIAKLQKELSAHKQLQKVLLQGDGFAGINRKIQLKPIEWEETGSPRVASSHVSTASSASSASSSSSSSSSSSCASSSESTSASASSSSSASPSVLSGEARVGVGGHCGEAGMQSSAKAKGEKTKPRGASGQMPVESATSSSASPAPPSPPPLSSSGAAGTAAGPPGRVMRCVVVAKWGGELTGIGRKQAEDLGKKFRYKLYPGRNTYANIKYRGADINIY